MSSQENQVPEDVEAGRETDERIAVEVMGEGYDVRPRGEVDTPLVRCYVQPPLRDGNWSRADLIAYGGLRAYSTDISAAWLVVEKLSAMGFAMELGNRQNGGGWYAQLMPWGEYEARACEDCGGISHLPYCAASTAPLAICRAALAATPPHIEQQISTPTPPRNP